VGVYVFGFYGMGGRNVSMVARRIPIRVDVAGMAIFVCSDLERRHLERVGRQMARMKLALHKLKWVDGSVGEAAKVGLGEEDAA
jgi:hypothetical protein